MPLDSKGLAGMTQSVQRLLTVSHSSTRARKAEAQGKQLSRGHALLGWCQCKWVTGGKAVAQEVGNEKDSG